MNSYQQKLTHPRWLQFRNEILDAHDGEGCEACGTEMEQQVLHIHHKRYIPGIPS